MCWNSFVQKVPFFLGREEGGGGDVGEQDYRTETNFSYTLEKLEVSTISLSMEVSVFSSSKDSYCYKDIFFLNSDHLRFLCKYSADGGRPSSASVFVGGFVLGSIVVGALGCIYAPQVLLEYVALDIY